MIFENILDTIGETPLVRINNICGSNAKVYAKIEFFNPGGSVKDRVAKALIEDAEKTGKIKENTLIIEPTSGNTGIGLAMVCAKKRYRLLLTMPDTVSKERMQILSGFGAETVLTPGKYGMQGAIEEAKRLSVLNPDSYIADQFSNNANTLTHFLNTAPEIWKDTRGKIDIFISAVGTGATLTGNAKFLKEKNPQIKIVAVEPYNSSVISQTINKEKISLGPHNLQGMGAGFIPNNLDISLIDEIVRVKNKDAFDFMKKLMKQEAIFAGISSGAMAYAASKIAQKNKNKTIVFIVSDTGERYLSENIL